jgi:hypothetical protein
MKSKIGHSRLQDLARLLLLESELGFRIKMKLEICLMNWISQ